MIRTFVLLLMSLMAGQSFGQDKQKKRADETPENEFYVRAGLGYAFPNAGQTGYSGTQTTSNGTLGSEIDFKLKPASFSAGLNLGVAAGYMFSPHLGAELGADFGVVTAHYTYTDQLLNPYGLPDNVVTKTYAKMPVFLLPSVVIRSGGSKLDVYSRLGLALPLSNKITVEMRSTRTNEDKLWIYDVTTRFRLGFSGALGLSVPLNKYLRVWGEASLLAIAPYLKERNLVNYTLNGANSMATLSTQEKSTHYEFSANVNRTFSTNEPLVEQTFSVPYSNIGFRLGMSFSVQ